MTTSTIEDELIDIEAMFVQTAQSVTSAETTMTLHGLAASTLCFSDRPRRVIGHLPARHFVDLWDVGDKFADDPPNAVLSFADHEGNESGLEDVVVVLKEPHLVGQDLIYSVDVLNGRLPAEAGSCVLFIDPSGQSVSAAGVTKKS